MSKEKVTTMEAYCVNKLMELEELNDTLSAALDEDQAIISTFRTCIDLMKSSGVVKAELNSSNGKKIIAFDWKRFHEQYDGDEFSLLCKVFEFEDGDFVDDKEDE